MRVEAFWELGNGSCFSEKENVRDVNYKKIY